MVGTGRFELPQARLCLAPLAGLTGAPSLRYGAGWGASASAVQKGVQIRTVLQGGMNGRDGQI